MLRRATLSLVFTNIKNLFYLCFLMWSTSCFALVSAYFADLDEGRVLFEENAQTELVPASVSKLVVAAQALETWGENKTFETQLWTQGAFSSKTGVLNGNLVFYGGGDPQFTSQALWSLVQQAWAAGLRHITGHLVINDSYFQEAAADSLRQGVSVATGKHAYDAPLSASSINFNTVEIMVAPGQRLGEKAQVSLLPPLWPPSALCNSIQTVNQHPLLPLDVKRHQDAKGRDMFDAKGQILLGAEPVFIYRSVNDSSFYLAKNLEFALNKIGIKQKHTPFALSHAVWPKADALNARLAWIQGPRMSDLIDGLFHFSNNFIADTLFLHIGKQALAKSYNEKTPSLVKSAQQELESFVQHATEHWRDRLQQQDPENTLLPAAALGAHFVSGSGLSLENRLSAMNLVAVLDHMYQSLYFPVYLADLPQAGQSGTVQRRLKQKNGVYKHFIFRVKSGTLHEGVPTSALAGYFRNAQGHWIAFAVVANAPEPRAQQLGLADFVDRYVLDHLSES